MATRLSDDSNRRGRSRWATPALAIALAAGCYHTDAPIEARGERYETPWLMVGSEDLRRDTMVGTPTKRLDEAGLLFVSIPVRNTTDLQLYVESQTTFFGPAGEQINTVRQTTTIPARGAANVTANSTSPTGGPMPFRVELRYPRVN